MFCVPFLGSESLSPEARNRFYTRLEATAFISVPTSKFDVGRLASKRQCNYILSIQQESLVSLSWVAGMWHGGAKAPVAEQASNGLTPSTKSLDVVKQSQKAPKIQFLTESKPSPLNSSRLKPSIRNFEEQLAVLERIHLQSQVPCNGTDLSEQAQVTHKLDIKSAQQKGNYHWSRVAYSYTDAQFSGSMNEMSVNGFHLKKQGCGIECPNVGEQVSTTTMVEDMEAKESVDVSSSSCEVACVRMPVYRMATPLQRSLSDSIFYLESLGADCSRLFRDDPTAMKCTVKQLRALVCALERHGLKWNDFGRIFNLCPKVLHLRPDGDLKAVTSFLFDEVGLSRKDFGKVTRRCPRLLVADIHEQLRPTLSFLRNLGYLKMGQVISNNPTLLSFSVERKLIPKLRFLESLGFSYREAASMVVRFPAIFNYSISDNLEPKYDYLVHKMGGRNKDLLAFPQYFGYSLETRIRPRHECIAKLDVSLSIQAILKLSDAEFNARFLPGGGHDRNLSASRETSDAMLQDCSLDSVQFASFEHPKVRALVSV